MRKELLFLLLVQQLLLPLRFVDCMICLPRNTSTTVPQMVKENGYPIEVHLVSTDDGYQVTVHRIPHGIKAAPANGTAVFLQHGLGSSSLSWVLNGPNKSLAYELADAGYDVWMGNVRGNAYSQLKTAEHDPDNKEYWQYSWHECALYDVTAMIDYALQQSKQEKLFYVGHSMGTTMFYVMTSQLPEYNNKIRAMFSFAPVAYMNHLKNPLFQRLAPFAKQIETVLHLVGVYEFIPENYEKVLHKICSAGPLEHVICVEIAKLMYGYNGDGGNASAEITIPHGMSTPMLVHYGQEIVSGEFAQYDHGIKNIITYGTLYPPTYNISMITAPIIMYYTEADDVASPIDIRRLYEELPNAVGMFKVQQENFTHADFVMHPNVTKLVYNSVMQFMEKYDAMNQ